MIANSQIKDIINPSVRSADFLCQSVPLVCEVELNRSSYRRRKRDFLFGGNMPSKSTYIRTLAFRKKLSKARKNIKFWNSGQFKKGRKCTKSERLRMSLTRRGENNSNWRGGRIYHAYGYIWIYAPNHPHAGHGKINSVLEHRLVVEKQIGRYLLSDEEVHHIGAKDDNRPKMLMAFVSHSAHVRFEKGGIVKPEEIIFDGRK